ncbi:preprotein translocase subunit SecA [Legionella sp. WA2022007384]
MKNSDVAFLYVKKHPTSFFSVQNKPKYLWTSSESGVIHNLTIPILKQFLMGWFKNPYAEKIAAMQLQSGNSEHTIQSLPFWRSRKAYLSLDTIAELDELGDWYDKSFLTNILLRKLDQYLENGFTIGINFREVFLVPEHEEPPSHFRPGIDVCVRTTTEYKKMTDRLSYQIGKGIFYQYKPSISARDPLNQTIANHYSNNPYSTDWDKPYIDYTTPLKNYRFFDSVFASFISYKVSISYEFLKTASISKVIALAYPINVSELINFFRNSVFYEIPELTFVFRGSQYENEFERQKVYEDILRLIKESKSTSMIHIFLITKDNINANLLELRPETQETSCLFQPLPQEAGYYLSSRNFLSATYRNIQELALAPDLFEKKLRLLNKIYEKTPQNKPTAYIYAKEVSENIRRSKTLSRGQLKSTARLSITQQESIAQTQVVNQQIQNTQQQAVNQQIQNTQQQAVNQQSVHAAAVSSQTTVASSWDLKVNLESFCRRLETFAKKKLPTVVNEEQLLKQAGCLTEFYLKHHSRAHFYGQLANDNAFRMQVAAKIFGIGLMAEEGLSSAIKIKLPHYAIDNIEAIVADSLIANIELIRDGLFEENRIIKDHYLFGRTLYDYTTTSNDIPKSVSSILLSRLWNIPSIEQKSPTEELFVPSLQPCILITEEELGSVDSRQKIELIQSVESLLKLFNSHPSLNKEEIGVLEHQFLVLIRFYCPNRLGEVELLEQFMARFTVHNEDNLKILLQILICNHKKGLDSFLKLLSFLKERALLDYFYKIYFQYAVNSSAVKEVLKAFLKSTFIRLAARIPISKSPDEWPDFDRFCLHLMSFAAENNFQITAHNLWTVEALWYRLYAKFLAYSENNEEEAQKLLSQLTSNLINDYGLCIAPVTSFETFATGLERLLDHAISKHALEEQIEEIKGISFLPMDVPYACTWNGFHVISSEMQIHASAINPKNNAYSISEMELLNILKSHQPDNSLLKTAVFRYLGAQNLRESLNYYRNLYEPLIHQAVSPNTKFISELLFAFYVTQYTGKGYHRDLDHRRFTEQFMAFIKSHSLSNSLSSDEIFLCINSLFLQLNKTTTDEHKGIQSLWSIWQNQHTFAYKTAKTPIPEIFLRKFPKKNIEHFLSTQKENLIKALPAINEVGLSPWPLIDVWCDELNSSPEYKKLIRYYLEKLYPKMDMGNFLGNFDKIKACLYSNNTIFQVNSKSFVHLVFDHFLDKTLNQDSFISLIQLVATEISKHENQPSLDKLTAHFLLILAKKPEFYYALANTKDLISTLLETFLLIGVKGDLNLLFNLMEILLPFGVVEAQQLFKKLIPLIDSEGGSHFLKSHSDLDATELRRIIQLLEIVKPNTLALNLLEGLYQQGLTQELPEIISLFEQKKEKDIRCLLLLGQVCQTKNKSLLTQLQNLNNKPIQDLKKIASIYKLKIANVEDVIKLLAATSLEKATALFLRKKYQENLERYDYNPEVIREQISQIKLKSHETDDDLPLSPQEQAQLLQDYQFVMSYMAQNPIKIYVDGVNKEVTINELNEREFQLLFKVLQEQLYRGVNVQRNQLLLIALSVEALYRTTNKFPRHTQILTLLKHIHYPGNIIHEIKTGEGKSIVAAMHAVLLCGMGRTVDIVTENDQLAKNALEKFSPFYQYLGIPYGKSIITAQSTHPEYIPNGINYSTASNLSLFRMRMALEKKVMPTNPSLVGDEIDATLTSTVQFRLAATIDLMGKDTKLWPELNKLLLEFVKEKEIYLNNPCSKDDDIVNLKNYFIAKKPSKEFLDFIQKIPNEFLGMLIESAMIAHELEEKEDYYIVKISEKGKEYFYAAPIIDSTKRPAPNVNYSEYVQQLLHTRLNNKQPPPVHPFKIEPSTETILVNSAKNFFDYYRLHNGPIIGLTGTAGSCVERAEFYTQQGLLAFSYPTFYPDRSKDLGLITVFGREEHLHKTFEWIKQHKLQNPTQPILLITRSPQYTELFKNFITSRTDWKIQSYHGFEEAGKSEENIIYTAGKDDVLTAANQSLARGADIDPEHEDGLLTINLCTDLTPSELRQIQGRSARNGKPGQFISIIDAQNLGNPSDSPETLAAAFRKHQLNISLKQQQERAKTRLLEEARNFMVNQILKLRETADKILASQYGEDNSIADPQQLLRSLSSLNRNAEKHYGKLLEQHPLFDDEVIDEFLSTRISDYQHVVDNWLPENQFNDVQFVQPSIPLETVKKLTPHLQTTVKQLRIFSDIFHRKWKLDGHKITKQNFDNLDELVELFDPYFKKKCSFKQALGNAVDEKGMLGSEQINAYVKLIKTSLDEMLEFAQTIPVIGKLVPVKSIRSYIENYIDTTKAKILEKKWDEIRLPTLDISSITTWFTGISHVLSVGSIFIGGPMSFIINRFIIPTIFGWIKQTLKRSFANSESLVAQILIGIDDIGNDLSEAIHAITTLDNEKITIGLLLDKFGPLVKNKALLLALSKYLELIEKPQYIPWLQVIPDVLELLEQYRECKPNELLQVDTVMAFLQHACHSKRVLNVLKNSPYYESLLQLSLLDSNFIGQISSFSFPEFINLIKITAHPNFFALMEQLPEETIFEELGQWLETIPDDLPKKSRQAIQELLDYQTNHERIAEENKQNMLNLRKTYLLTLSKFKSELAKLKPVVNAVAPKLEQEVKDSSEHFSLKQLVVLMATVAFISYSFIYLSIPVALVCFALAAWMVAPVFLNQFSAQSNEQSNLSEKTALLDEIPSFVLNEDMQSKLLVHEKIRQKARGASNESIIPTLSNSKLGFFMGKKTSSIDMKRGVSENKLPSTSPAEKVKMPQLVVPARFVSP